MQLITMSWVRNEEDVLRSFIEHHTNIADHIVIIDNDSTDGSRRLLQSYVDAGAPITLHEDSTPYHAQAEALTALARDISAAHTDAWILPLDADEFLCGANENVHGLIESLPREVITLVPWRTYVPSAKVPSDETDVRKRIQYRRAYEPQPFSKVIIPPGAFDAECSVAPGSHHVLGTTLPHRQTDQLWLAHFPVRSPAQIQRKIIEGWERHCRNPLRKPGDMFHWEQLYEEMRHGMPSPERTRAIARTYAAATSDDRDIPLEFDPVPSIARGSIALTA